MTYLPPTVPAVRCYNSTNFSVPNNANTAVTYDTNSYDAGTATAQHSTSSNTSRLVCQVAGIYKITANGVYAVNTGGSYRVLQLRLNGTTFIATGGSAFNAGSGPYVTVTMDYQLVVGDYVECIAYQDCSVSLNLVQSSTWSPSLMMVRIG